MEQRFGIGRQVGVDDEFEARQVDAAGGNIVAIQTRARPSRIACSAWVRSFWLNSPERATTEKPRLWSRAVRWFTAARVEQKTMVLRAS